MTMEGDRPAEGTEELPYGSHYYGPFHPQPVKPQEATEAEARRGPSFESHLDWPPPVEQPAPAAPDTVLPTASSTDAPAGPLGNRLRAWFWLQR